MLHMLFVRRAIPCTTSRFASTTATKRATNSKQIVDGKLGFATTHGSKVVDNESLKANTVRSPGNPDPHVASGSFLDVKIPLPEVEREAQIQVPFLPDFWDSAKLTTDSPVMEQPKVIVVGDTETHHGSEPTHTIEEVNVSVEIDSAQTKVERSDSFLDDIAEDFHLPPIHEIQSSVRKIFS